MRIWIISDLHLEFDEHFELAIPDADVCIVAGDVTNGVGNAVRWLDQHVATAMPVVFVPGNHEFYRDSIVEGREWGRKHAEECLDVHLLDNGVAVIGGVRFVGTTLWTDFKLDGDPDWAAANFQHRMNDCRAIAWQRSPIYEGFGPVRALQLHYRAMDFLREQLATPFDGPTVVVSHHAPHPNSVHWRWKGSSLNPSFASDLSEMMEVWKPEMWVHGHVHDSFDYVVRNTRVLCNPRGYLTENAAFDPAKIVEV
jgi:Icc-related predicted phosphoesterase